MRTADHWIQALDLVPLPEEGGLYREVYRSEESVAKDHLPPRFESPRTFSTAIYYLLRAGEFSAFHTVQQDELWHFYDGAPLHIHVLSPTADAQTLALGPDLARGQRPMAVVPRGHLFAAQVAGEMGFTLCGCTVAPGFEFVDFCAPSRLDLLDRFPAHSDLIQQFTRAPRD